MTEYCATDTDDNPHQAGTGDNQAKRPCSYCDLFSNIKILWTVIAILSVLLIVLLIVIGVITDKKPNDNNSNCFQPKRDSERITRPNNDPICQFPFPCTNVSFMKCFLPYKGQYTVNCVFDSPAQVTRICALNDTNYHYKLDCASSFGNNCNQVCSENYTLDCKDECTQVSITIHKSGILLLEIGDSCLPNDGYIEIWNAMIHRRGKRERQSENLRNREQKYITRK
ncbi:unnamed protein product [Mytilus coruscus]|uniref:Uncharacterized protein n=1 Tax=Mytilus coruscus TaxID=42192 RepID=A0A6J8AEJ0_MYTCO|nr:unnamed protein product [Mytilus coruscus]